jgi:hypothetical protein
MTIDGESTPAMPEDELQKAADDLAAAFPVLCTVTGLWLSVRLPSGLTRQLLWKEDEDIATFRERLWAAIAQELGGTNDQGNDQP